MPIVEPDPGFIARLLATYRAELAQLERYPADPVLVAVAANVRAAVANLERHPLAPGRHSAH